MQKRRRRRKHHLQQSNDLLQEKLEYTGTNTTETSITQFCFDHESCVQQTIDANTFVRSNTDKTTWIQVKGLSNAEKVGKLCEQFEIPRLIIQDILTTQHIAKIDYLNDFIFVVSNVFSYSAYDTLENEHICLILGKNFVLSFQESNANHFAAIENALKTQQGRISQQHADYLFNFLFSTLIDCYLEVLEIQQNLLLDMEDSLMEFQSIQDTTNISIHNYRHDYLLLKKSLFPLKEQFSQLLLWDDSLIAKENHIYFRDTNDHLQQAYMIIEGNRETIASILDLYLANNDLRMNHIMKQLTVVASIFIPLTFLVGLWGMNFRFMPELEWKYGYLFSWIIIIASGICSYVYFRKKK
ncbi:MAG: magnesium/cobalt transporter CorA, partial [Bacteroidales bacterium]|nr:magnesium/cobalt transporter CorA [Bacteroidales bacterium]